MNNINFFDDSKLRGPEPTEKTYHIIRRSKDEVQYNKWETYRVLGVCTVSPDLPISVIEDMLRHAEAYN